MVWAYHPGTDAAFEIDEAAMPQMRRSGWLTMAEHNANQAEIAERAAAAEKAASKTAGKTGAKEN